jgi:hypothetical protein
MPTYECTQMGPLIHPDKLKAAEIRKLVLFSQLLAGSKRDGVH